MEERSALNSDRFQDCTERPRRIGGKWTNENLSRDEVVIDLDGLEWDAKRDRWNGFDPETYNEVHDEYKKVDEMKLQWRAQKVESEMAEEDELKGYTEDVSMPGQKFDAKKRISVRNLR